MKKTSDELLAQINDDISDKKYLLNELPSFNSSRLYDEFIKRYKFFINNETKPNQIEPAIVYVFSLLSEDQKLYILNNVWSKLFNTTNAQEYLLKEKIFFRDFLFPIISDEMISKVNDKFFENNKISFLKNDDIAKNISYIYLNDKYKDFFYFDKENLFDNEEFNSYMLDNFNGWSNKEILINFFKNSKYNENNYDKLKNKIGLLDEDNDMINVILNKKISSENKLNILQNRFKEIKYSDSVLRFIAKYKNNNIINNENLLKNINVACILSNCSNSESNLSLFNLSLKNKFIDITLSENYEVLKKLITLSGDIFNYSQYIKQEDKIDLLLKTTNISDFQINLEKFEVNSTDFWNKFLLNIDKNENIDKRIILAPSDIKKEFLKNLFDDKYNWFLRHERYDYSNIKLIVSMSFENNMGQELLDNFSPKIKTQHIHNKICFWNYFFTYAKNSNNLIEFDLKKNNPLFMILDSLLYETNTKNIEDQFCSVLLDINKVLEHKIDDYKFNDKYIYEYIKELKIVDNKKYNELLSWGKKGLFDVFGDDDKKYQYLTIGNEKIALSDTSIINKKIKDDISVNQITKLLTDITNKNINLEIKLKMTNLCFDYKNFYELIKPFKEQLSYEDNIFIENGFVSYINEAVKSYENSLNKYNLIEKAHQSSFSKFLNLTHNVSDYKEKIDNECIRWIDLLDKQLNLVKSNVLNNLGEDTLRDMKIKTRFLNNKIEELPNDLPKIKIK